MRPCELNTLYCASCRAKLLTYTHCESRLAVCASLLIRNERYVASRSSLWFIHTCPISPHCSKAVRRQQEFIKTTIRTLRTEHNLPRIQSSFHDDIPSLQKELSSLLDEIGTSCTYPVSHCGSRYINKAIIYAAEKEKKIQQRELLRAEIHTLRSAHDLTHVRRCFKNDLASVKAEYDAMCAAIPAQLAAAQRKQGMF